MFLVVSRFHVSLQMFSPVVQVTPIGTGLRVSTEALRSDLFLPVAGLAVGSPIRSLLGVVR